MNSAFIKDNEVIPFDSVEYVEDVSSDEEHVNIEIHMRESRKSMRLNSDTALEFLSQYHKYLTAINKALTGLEQS